MLERDVGRALLKWEARDHGGRTDEFIGCDTHGGPQAPPRVQDGRCDAACHTPRCIPSFLHADFTASQRDVALIGGYR